MPSECLPSAFRVPSECLLRAFRVPSACLLTAQVGACMQMILERTEIHESGKLADFGAALTTADAQALQEVLSTLIAC